MFNTVNFGFLKQHDQTLLQLAALAERYVFTDPNTALIKIRQLAESLAKSVASLMGIPCGAEQSFLDVEKKLREKGALDRSLQQVMRTVRLAGNEAVHNLAGEKREAFQQLKLVRQIAVWFHKTVTRDPNFQAGPFQPPADPSDADEEFRKELQFLREELAKQKAQLQGVTLEGEELQRLAQEAGQKAAAAYANEQAAIGLATEMEAELNRLRTEYTQLLNTQTAATAKQPPEVREEVATASRQAASTVDLDEFDTRVLIDQQLRDAGWEVDTAELRYSKGARPQKGKNLAIAEWPTSDGGSADYVLFSGLMPLASIEAKRRRRNAKNAIGQAERYSRFFDVMPDFQSPGGPWGQFRLPFVFSSNGNPYQRQFIDASGVWFRDTRLDTNHSRALTSWYSPSGLADLLGVDTPAAERKLEVEPSDYLPLRPYQREGIAAVENAIIAGKREILLAMATGTGKTRTCICLLYRLIKAKRFRRILFLVDRTALATQALDSFADVKLENHQSFPEIYDVKGIGDTTIDRETRLHVATVQSMVRRLIDIEDNAGEFPVDQYDCIVVDECHRGYILDREMTDEELLYRDQDDFISKYRRVLDHFDAVRIGLTATPALHTTEIFGKAVFEYSYRQAVIDHYLVDHEPPYVIKTELSRGGMHWQSGETIKLLDTLTGSVVTDQTPDEIDIDIEGFNRVAITEPFNQVVCEVLAEHINPDAPGKTLIFCVRDHHADTVVRLLTSALEARYGPQHHKLVQKITGDIDNQSEAIRHFKNEQMPKYVVTVDLLTTGIDVPEITNLVFLRCTKSRILFEQMIGRATRLKPNLNGPGSDKEYFRVFDAVNIYQTLQRFTNMKPVVASPKTTFETLANLLQTQADPAIIQSIREQFVSKLRRKIDGIQDKWSDEFLGLAGAGPESIANQLQRVAIADLRNWLTEKVYLIKALDRIRHGSEVLISEHTDRLLSVERGYGNGQKPADYLESLRSFLNENAEDLPALVLVAQRPRDLTRKALRELQLQLELKGFTETNIKAAVRDTTNQDIAATIIGYIRYVMNNEPLISFEERVDNALQKILASQEWSEEQRKWLDRIGKQVRENVILDRESFDQDAFKGFGGFNRVNRLFDGNLHELMNKFVDEIWQHAA